MFWVEVKHIVSILPEKKKSRRVGPRPTRQRGAATTTTIFFIFFVYLYRVCWDTRKEKKKIRMKHPPRTERDGFQQSFSNARPYPPSAFLSLFIFLSLSLSLFFLLSSPSRAAWLHEIKKNIPKHYFLLLLLIPPFILFFFFFCFTPLPAKWHGRGSVAAWPIDSFSFSLFSFLLILQAFKKTWFKSHRLL